MKSRYSFLFACAYLAGVTALIYLAYAGQRYDDPFITYRYAENLARGYGFVYNPGERVLSTTTPLFTLLLAGVFSLSDDLPTAANLIGAIGIALGGIFLWDLARSWRTPVVGWAGLLLYPSFSLVLMTVGSETPIYLAFCLGAFAMYGRRDHGRQRYGLAALFCALAVLTRPDGILVAMILGVHYSIVRLQARNLQQSGQVNAKSPKGNPFPWLALAVFFILIAPWLAFGWGYFGSIVPATLAVKQHQGAMAISEQFAPGLITVFRPYTRQWFFWIEVVLASAGLIWLFTRDEEAKRHRRWILPLAWTGVYFIGYALLGVSRYYWYYAPLIPGFIVAVGLGFALVTAILKNRPTLSKWSAMIVILTMLVLALGQAINSWRVGQRVDSRMAIYRAVGTWLKDNTPADATVGALEVGAIGYYSRRPMVDFAGLIQPEVAQELKYNTTYDDSARWAFAKFLPDYLVLQEGNLPGLEGDLGASGCRIMNRFSGQDYGHTANLNIWTCSP